MMKRKMMMMRKKRMMMMRKKKKVQMQKRRKKRKIEDETESQSKKQKTDEIVTIQFTELPENLNDSVFEKFLKSKGIECISCRANYGRQKAFIDVNADDKGKV